MSKRTYNIYFHLHTISGILLTVGLYVIFFAGAFSLFLAEIQEWEVDKGTRVSNVITTPAQRIDLDRLLKSIEENGTDLYGRSVYMDLSKGGAMLSVLVTKSADSLAAGESKRTKNLLVDRANYEVTEKGETLATLGDLLYELHFFYQLGEFGYFLSGVVSLFFLFAMVSGVIVHWRKIVSNFFLFRPYAKLKSVWTDAHTALGTIGIPFQFMYAVTGAMFGLGVVVTTSASWLYGGDESKYYDELYGKHEETLGARIDLSNYNLDSYIERAASTWQGFVPYYIAIRNARSANMQLTVYGDVIESKSFFNYGEIVFDVVPGTVNHMHAAAEKSYDEMVDAMMHRIHFGDFSLNGWQAIAIRVMYFLLAVATCFVIVSGVLIWLTARRKKHVPDKERRFNEGVGHVYLALCLSMFPVTAFSFIVSRFISEDAASHRGLIINAVFFAGWLLVSIFFWLQKSNYYTNKYTLLSGGIFGLCIPVVNGIASGNWMWTTFNSKPGVFITDVLWLVLAVLALVSVYMVNRHQAKSKTPDIPPDYETHTATECGNAR